ncbi:uncharacterized protein C8A04DRAFT_13942 [Dichotomopilus funicola]|uniref:Tyrosinase copper-binding domain-containing protein n=1 Tax=Dichotomopilus funicola TaxID=1934379 RepID=A0AAN6UYU1_9PEZI|nr:hypothetical protein C8A04DRAFT_13942 [Dichotomopilus funicola]
MTRFGFSLLLSLVCLTNILVLATHYPTYDYGPNMKKRIRRELDRRSPIVLRDKTGGDIQVRQEIRQLEKDKDVWTLYILGLSMMQYTDQTSPTSYYGLAGIHGMPHQSWGGVQPVAGNEDTGYCTHSSVLFPAWHRPYMALYEQVLQDLTLMIATFWPEDQRPRYEAAARRFRHPYWDWALAPLSGESVLPKSIGGSPYIDIDGPSGVQRISNPLFSYSFKPLDKAAFSSGPWNSWVRTLRSPSSNGPDAQSNNSAVAKNLDQNRASIAQRLYTLFSSSDNYTTFSNNAASGNSIEALHDSIHTLVGGLGPSWPSPQPGHMAYTQWAGFDPIFFLHHCMVDRIFALWQAIHPNQWVVPSQALLNSYTTRRGQEVNGQTPLTPFYKHENGTFWTADGIRDHTKLGYTYAELLRRSSDTVLNSELAAEGAGQSQSVKHAVNQLYGGSSPASRFLVGLSAEGGANGAKTGHKVPHLSSIESKIFFGANSDQYHEWHVLIRAKPQTPNGTDVSAVALFLGTDDIPAERSDWATAPSYVGSTVMFVPATTDTGPARMMVDFPVSGSIPLTEILVEKVIEGQLEGLAPKYVVPYLNAQLKRVVLGPKGDVVAGEQDKCVEGMQIRVVSSEVEAPWSDEELPQWGEQQVGLELC